MSVFVVVVVVGDVDVVVYGVCCRLPIHSNLD